MTGGQNAAGALPVPALSRRLEAEGVKKIIVTTDDTAKYSGTSIAGNAEVWHRDRLARGPVGAGGHAAASPC